LRATLGNGLRVVIVRDPVGPVVTTEMNYLVGSDDCPPDFPGMAHAQEHMMFRGVDGLTADQLTAITAELGGDVNADTRETVTQYHFTVPAGDLDLALRVDASRMRDVDDSETEWERERGAIEQEVSMDDSSPQYILFRSLDAVAFADTPYGRDGVGTRESFDKTTGAMLKGFYDRWYGPNNAILVIAGDVDPQSALADVTSLFGGIQPRPTPAHAPVELQPLHDARVEVPTNFAYQLDFVSYRLPGYDSPDFVAGQILVDVLQSRRGGLASLVAQGIAIASSFDQSAPLPKAGLGTAVTVTAPGQDRSAAASAVQRVFSDYARDGVPDDLVEAAKHRELVQAAEDQTSVPLVADAWSEALAVGGRDSPDVDVAAIAGVTTADVDRVAAEYLAPDQAITSEHGSSGPRPGGAGPAGDTFAPTDTKAVALPDWAAAKLLALDLPASAPPPASAVLTNGIRVIVQPESGNPSVEVLGEVKNAPEVEAPQGQEGVAGIEDDLFTYGSVSLDRVQFQAALDSIGADAQAGTRFSIQMLAPDLDRGLALISDNELHPAFPDSAFSIVQQQHEGLAQSQSNSADFQVQRSLDRALYPLFDPALRVATPDSVASITLDDVKDYYAKTFRPDLTTIVVIGDVTPGQAVAEVGKYFGDWQSYASPPLVDLPPVPPNAPASSVLSPPGELQDVVTMSETLGVVRSDPDFYALRLGDELLGGATLASRLYHDLREERGLVYYIDSNLDVGQTRSAYTIRFACDPANVSRAREIVREDLVAMQTTTASADELQRAKALLIRQIPLAEASETDIADGLLDRAETGLSLDEPSQAAAAYVSLSADDVKKAFAQWIRPDGFVEVVEGPSPR
jgi:zinc protease